MIKVGDYVKYIGNFPLSKGVKGTVRYIGKLCGTGNYDSVWSEWDKKWNGKVLPCSKYEGQLSWISESELEIIKKDYAEVFGIVKFTEEYYK